MISPERAETATAGTADWEAPGERVREVDLHDAFEECGVAFFVHCEDVDFAEDAYASILGEAAALSGGSVTFTDIRLMPTETGLRRLHFRRNGEPRCWTIEQEADDYLVMDAVACGIEDLDPGGGDPRLFHQISPVDQDDVYILATTEQALALEAEYHLGIQVRGLPGAAA